MALYQRGLSVDRDHGIREFHLHDVFRAGRGLEDRSFVLKLPVRVREGQVVAQQLT